MRALLLVIALGPACRQDVAPLRPERPPEPIAATPTASASLRVPVTTEPSPALGPTTPEAPPAPVPTDANELAKQHFQAGVEAFERGDFAVAIVAFTAADALVPKAALLFNVAKAREKLGDLGGARSTYAAVLNRADVDSRLGRQVSDAIARIDRIIRDGEL